MKLEHVAVNLSGLDQFKASALLVEPLVREDGAPMQVPLAAIDFDLEQPRRKLDPAALAELAASIQQQGVLEPVSLRRHPDQVGRYVVNRGERRVRASRQAGLMEVPAFIDARLDRYAQVVENIQREDLSLFDLAVFIAEREQAGETRVAIARRLGKPPSFITEVASLRNAPARVRDAVEAGRIADSRTLYLLARAANERADLAATVLAGDGPITRLAVEEALTPSLADSKFRMRNGASGGPKPAGRHDRERAISPKNLGNALLVEHEGRRGRLTWNEQPSKRRGEVLFEDGTRQVVSLGHLILIAWTTS